MNQVVEKVLEMKVMLGYKKDECVIGDKRVDYIHSIVRDLISKEIEYEMAIEKLEKV